MEQQVIKVEQRNESGKGAARRARRAGKIPGVLYGHKQAPVSLSLDPNELKKRVKASGLGRNTVFKVEGLGREVLALLKDAQTDPLKRTVLHVDFVEVRESDRVVVEVPFELTGKPVGVTAGGVLQVVRRTVALECSPLAIPAKLSFDVTNLGLNEALHVDDVKLPEGTKSVGGNYAIATIHAPREVEERPAAAEGAAEGAAAAEGGDAKAAAKPAAEAKAPAKK
ncbi:50S ribosomal protein L25/general stress protein Ctc [Myxococcota bacterium]|nr:50S ribosomal protein L25/general stress protein Ctc [Myxococcota bacterium]